jgi:hypothetical protein
MAAEHGKHEYLDHGTQFEEDPQECSRAPVFSFIFLFVFSICFLFSYSFIFQF